LKDGGVACTNHELLGGEITDYKIFGEHNRQFEERVNFEHIPNSTFIPNSNFEFHYFSTFMTTSFGDAIFKQLYFFSLSK